MNAKKPKTVPTANAGRITRAPVTNVDLENSSPEVVEARLTELATYPQNSRRVQAEIERAQEWLDLAIKRQAYGYTWTPSGVMVPGNRSDGSEDMIAGVTLDTDYNGSIEDAPHDRIYAEVRRRAAEKKAAAEKKP